MTTPADGWDEDERDLPEELTRALSSLRDTNALPIDVLRAAGSGVLPEALEREAQACLERDPRVRALVQELNGLPEVDAHTQARLWTRISRDAQGAGTSKTYRRLWQLAAMFGAVAVAGALWLTISRNGDDAPAISTTTPATPVAPAAPSAPAPETFLVPLERPEVRISLRALTWRGSERANPILAALKPALDAFRAADYQRADVEFSAVDKAHPDLIEVALYQGVARLFLGDIAGATTSLQRAERINDPAFANDVQWYLAVAEERGGNATAARERLARLCPDGTGDPRACSVLAGR